MSRRQESIPYMLIHDFPWWVSTVLAGVVYALMRWVAPTVSPDDPLLGPLTKALPGSAWMGAGLLLMLAGLNLYVKFLKRVFQRPPAIQPQNVTGGIMCEATTAPPCPSCGGSMVTRTAKRGTNAGKRFWGCAQYPACEGTLSL